MHFTVVWVGGAGWLTVRRCKENEEEEGNESRTCGCLKRRAIALAGWQVGGDDWKWEVGE